MRLIRTLLCLMTCSLSVWALDPWWELQPGESLLNLPMDPAAAAEAWENTEYYETIPSEELGRNVLHPTRLSYLVSKTSFEPPYEVNMRVRWVDREGPRYGAALYVGATTADPRVEAPAYRVSLRPYVSGTRKRMNTTLTRGNSIINSIVDKAPRSYDDRRLTLMPRFEEVSPVWDVAFRNEIEAAMSACSDLDTAWMQVRIVVEPSSLSVYVNGLCMGEYHHPETVSGRVLLEARPQNMQLAELTVTRPVKTEGFMPVMLDGVVNAKAMGARVGLALAPDALPPAGSRLKVMQVPFILPSRGQGDHLDVGTSLFHYRNNDMRVNMRNLWPTPGQLDGNRLVVSIPNRPYKRLWVLAASDGDADSVPLLTVRAYRQSSGFPIDAQAEIPGISATSATGAIPLVVMSAEGKPQRLWMVPIDLDGNRIASELREEETLALEFTKQVHDYTPYPDPMYFSSFQGGQPSGVRIFAATLEEAAATLTTRGKRPGSVFMQPEHPVWLAELTNTTTQEQYGQLKVDVVGPYGKPLPGKVLDLTLQPGETRTVTIPLRTEAYGLHAVTTTWSTPLANALPIVSKGRFVQLPADNRRTTQKNSRWGLWVWHGGHGTNPDPDENGYLTRASGARGVGQRDYADRSRWGLFARPMGLSYRAPAWAFDDPNNLEKQQAYATEMVEKARKILEENPDNPWLCYYLEDVPSVELMFGEYPKYLGKEGTAAWTPEQKAAYEGRFLAAKVAFEAVRKEFPKARLSLGWTHPQFQIPLLRMGFPAELFDAIGIDFPTFMRMPEMPLRDISPNRMWLLTKEMQDLGYGDKTIVHHETYFPSSQPQALGEKVGADYTVRFGVLSLALGSDDLHHCFSLHDCADYWGSQHYGASGLIGKRPEYVPKPAFPAYAAMTRLLDSIRYETYLPTGSLSTYCVGFRNLNALLPYSYVYSLWTLRGERDLQLTFTAGATVYTVDAQGNEQPLALTDNGARLTLSGMPLWVLSSAPLTATEVVGTPTYQDKPSGPTKPLGTLGEGWRYTARPYPRLEENNPVLAPFYAGPMGTREVKDPEGGKALQVVLQKTPEERPTVDWYGVFQPNQEVPISGKAMALGLWVNGKSSWGRVIYEIEDANGEHFLSTGAKENWNGDDSRQRSYFNFDGWRYIEFPLPTSEAYDGYRGFANVWWSWDQDGIVDLPIKLSKIIVTHRTHQVYVNELVEIPDRSVEIGQIVAVYGQESDATQAPITAQQGMSLPVPTIDPAQLPNPHRDLATSELPAPELKGFTRPDTWYDGTQIMVHITPVEDVRSYNIYVSAYPDGAGAAVMGSGTEPDMLVRRLRPEYPLYFFVTYLNARRVESKPSAIQKLLLKDDFPNK